MKKRALIMVDLQNDFCPGGGLAVPEGDEVIPLANRLQTYFDVVIATKDWHPQDHMSFASNHPGHKVGDVIDADGLQQILWPDHCVQETKGAEFHPQLDISRIEKIFFKGIDKSVDSYSAFFDNAHLRTTGLADFLMQKNIQDIYFLGLATDYCVKYSCLDSVRMGFSTHIIIDACRGVELFAGDVDAALQEMQDAGVVLVRSDDIVVT